MLQGHALLTRALGSVLPCPAIDFVGGVYLICRCISQVKMHFPCQLRSCAIFGPVQSHQHLPSCLVKRVSASTGFNDFMAAAFNLTGTVQEAYGTPFGNALPSCCCRIVNQCLVRDNSRLLCRCHCKFREEINHARKYANLLFRHPFHHCRPIFERRQLCALGADAGGTGSYR